MYCMFCRKLYARWRSNAFGGGDQVFCCGNAFAIPRLRCAYAYTHADLVVVVVHARKRD